VKTAIVRLFLAIPVPCTVMKEQAGAAVPGSASGEQVCRLPDVVHVLDRMGRVVRTVDDASLHVTLPFLGDTPERLVPDVIAAAERAVVGTASFAWSIRGLGAFPSRDRPTVVWAGLEPTGACERLAARLADELEAVADLGFVRETRRYHPHLTLARIKGRPPRDLADLLRTHAQTMFGSYEVDHIELMQSELTPGGPKYASLARIDLAG